MLVSLKRKSPTLNEMFLIPWVKHGLKITSFGHVVEINSVGEERSTNGKNVGFLKKALHRGMMLFSPNHFRTAHVRAVTPI